MKYHLPPSTNLSILALRCFELLELYQIVNLHTERRHQFRLLYDVDINQLHSSVYVWEFLFLNEVLQELDGNCDYLRRVPVDTEVKDNVSVEVQCHFSSLMLLVKKA